MLALIAALVVTSPSRAQELIYEFTGTITASSAGSVQAGDSFSGRWRVDISQPGVDISSPGFDGREYVLHTLEIDINGESVLVSSGAVFVSESVIDPAFAETWPSGFSSDYVISAASPNLPRWNTEVFRYRIAFSYDGLGVWNALALRDPFDFMHQAAVAGLIIDTAGGEFGGNGEIHGRIDSVASAPAPVPLPASLGLGGAGLLVLACRGRRRVMPVSLSRH